MEKWIKYGLYVGATILLFLLFQQECAYDFFYAEQLRTFLFSKEFAWTVLSKPGGLLEYVASFLVQFYVYDYVGPLVTSVLFFLIVWLCDKWLNRFGLSSLAPLGSVLLGGVFIILELDMEFKTEGTLAVITCLALLNLYAMVPSFKLRLGVLAVLVPLFYWVMGPALMALVIGVCLLETSNKRYAVWALLPWGFLPVALWWYMGDCGEARLVFLPDIYYNPHLVPKMKLYYPWNLLLIMTSIGCLWRLFGLSLSWKKWTPVMYGLQVVISMACFGYLFNLAHGAFSYQMKRLECYRIRGEWDKVLSENLISSKNELHACYQNLALAHKGVLADSLFHYPQCPPKGLVIEWQGSRQHSDLLSDVFWLQGNVAQAQKMAFDAMYFNEHFMHPRVMLRLIETNLVLGEPKVAEKYIRLCEQSHYYADKATEYRKFLSEEGENLFDGSLAEIEKCLPGHEDAILSNFYKDMQSVLSGHPGYLPAVHYLGSKLLLDNNLEVFKYFMENICDAKQLNPMPLHFQEALLMIYDEDTCKEYGVTEQTIAKYHDFQEKIAKVKTQNDIVSIYKAGYGKTFWVHSNIYEKQTRR